MRLEFAAAALFITFGLPAPLQAAIATYTVEEAVALAQAQNPEIAIARKQVQAARGGLIEARSGYLPSVASTGLFDKRQHQGQSNLRNEDYNASLRVLENLYTGGAVPSPGGNPPPNNQKQDYELQANSHPVALDVKVAFNELLLHPAKNRRRPESVP